MITPRSKQTSNKPSVDNYSNSYRTGDESASMNNSRSKRYSDNYFDEDEINESYDDDSYDSYNGYDTE